jgi:hypothetical protein
MEAAAVSTKLATPIGGTKDPIKKRLVPPRPRAAEHNKKPDAEWNNDNNKRGGGLRSK